MIHSRKNKGVCSRKTTVELEVGVIKSIKIDGGCDGNVKGLAALLIGAPAAQAAERLKGIKCGRKSTSCPEQIALCLEEALLLD